MSREIKLDDDAFRIRYRGLSAWVLMLREVALPYGEIEDVSVGLPTLPRFRIRIGQYIPKRSIRGRFKAKGEWYFVDADVRRREQVVVARTLPGSRFVLVAVESEGAEALAAELRARL